MVFRKGVGFGSFERFSLIEFLGGKDVLGILMRGFEVGGRFIV